jgi:hypothetical protein
MIRAIFKKDWILLWPLAALVAVIQVVLEWSGYKQGFFGANPVHHELFRMLFLPWNVGIVALAVAAVHEETIPGADQDWLVRPLRRSDLLLAKMLFVATAVCLPMFVVNFAQELKLGFPWLPSLWDALYKQVFVFLCLIVPVMAFASATRNLRELIVLAALLVVLYALCLWASALLFGSNRCPTCDSSLEWQQHVLQHIGVLGGSVVVLGLQYYRRKTQVSRWVLAAGTVALIFVQLPWGVAFGLQSALGAERGTAPPAIKIQAGIAQATDNSRGGPVGQESARRIGRLATQALLKGNIDAAVENLKHLEGPGAADVVLSVPIEVEGLSDGEFIAVDRAEFALLDARGGVLYRGVNPPRRPIALLPDRAHSDQVHQDFEMPAALYAQLRPRAATLNVDLYLTVRVPVAEHRIAATEGEFRAVETGVCQSSSDATGIYIRCRNIGRAESCLAATLFGPDGQHNPRVLGCSADYRPFIPSALNIISWSGIDLQLRDQYGIAHYQVDNSNLPQSYIVLQVFEAGRHFKRTVRAQLPPP